AWSSTNRVVIEGVYPELDGGRHPVKRVVGETFEVWADIFRDGHDVIAAALLLRAADERAWRRAPMALVDNDPWPAQVRPERHIRHVYTVEAWTDVFASWRRDLVKKLDAQQDVTVELTEGRQVLERAAKQAVNGPADRMRAALGRFDKAGDVGERAAAL